jgi:hypothetical protein
MPTKRKAHVDALGVPELCFSFADTLPEITKKDMARRERYRKQRLRRGWDDTETWSLDTTVPLFILRRFRELQKGYPVGTTEKAWGRKLDKMIRGFELASTMLETWADEADAETREALRKEMKEGLRIFADNLLNLWW